MEKFSVATIRTLVIATAGVALTASLGSIAPATAAPKTFSLSGNLIDVTPDDVLGWQRFSGTFSYDPASSSSPGVYPLSGYTISFFGSSSSSPLETISLDNPLRDTGALTFDSSEPVYRLLISAQDAVVGFEDGLVELFLSRFEYDTFSTALPATPPGQYIGGDFRVGTDGAVVGGVENAKITAVHSPATSVPESNTVGGLSVLGLSFLLKRKVTSSGKAC